ncbi:uncharacterized protein [Glycine max]|nr:uncharacterized protein LOC100527710 isoform X4 [Glycine max]|eukprot:XP_014624787.1 uncharacterized protein LOC100527710 isoform X4 [Glycine max]
MKQPADHLENMEKRKSSKASLMDKFHSSLGIFHHALEGNVLKAIELTGQLAQDILENNNDLLFDLLSLHFVDLVCSKEWAEALEFAQTKLSPFSVKEQKYMEKIEGFMSLLAYENPVECPMFHLIGLDYRQQVVDSLNQTILGWLTSLYSVYLIYILLQISILCSIPAKYDLQSLSFCLFFSVDVGDGQHTLTFPSTLPWSGLYNRPQ